MLSSTKRQMKMLLNHSSTQVHAIETPRHAAFGNEDDRKHATITDVRVRLPAYVLCATTLGSLPWFPLCVCVCLRSCWRATSL